MDTNRTQELLQKLAEYRTPEGNRRGITIYHEGEIWQVCFRSNVFEDFKLDVALLLATEHH